MALRPPPKMLSRVRESDGRRAEQLRAEERMRRQLKLAKKLEEKRAAAWAGRGGFARVEPNSETMTTQWLFGDTNGRRR